MKYNNYYAYSFFIQRSVKPWWKISANALAAYIEYAGDVNGTPFKTASFYYAPSVSNTFLAPKNIKVETIAFYNSPKNDGFVQIKSCWMFSFAVKKAFLKGALDCSIGVDDLFYANRRRTKVNFENQNWNYDARDDTRRLVVSVNYNFGKITITKKETIGNKEEKDRLSH